MDGKGTSRSQHAMTTVARLMDGWNTIPWSRIQRNVFKLQKRIYQAARRGDVRTVRRLQRLMMQSWSAKLLAVRRIAQDNRGRRTAGVDGVKSLPPPETLRAGAVPHPRWHGLSGSTGRDTQIGLDNRAKAVGHSHYGRQSPPDVG